MVESNKEFDPYDYLKSIEQDAGEKYDLFNVFASLIYGFKANRLSRPVAIVLESAKDGIEFMAAIRQKDKWLRYITLPDPTIQIVNIENTRYRQVEVLGVQVRWPAIGKELPDGSVSWY